VRTSPRVTGFVSGLLLECVGKWWAPSQGQGSLHKVQTYICKGEGQEPVVVATDPVTDSSIPEAAQDFVDLVLLFDLAVEKIKASQLESAHHCRINLACKKNR